MQNPVSVRPASNIRDRCGRGCWQGLMICILPQREETFLSGTMQRLLAKQLSRWESVSVSPDLMLVIDLLSFVFAGRA